MVFLEYCVDGNLRIVGSIPKAMVSRCVDAKVKLFHLPQYPDSIEELFQHYVPETFNDRLYKNALFFQADCIEAVTRQLDYTMAKHEALITIDQHTYDTQDTQDQCFTDSDCDMDDDESTAEETDVDVEDDGHVSDVPIDV